MQSITAHDEAPSVITPILEYHLHMIFALLERYERVSPVDLNAVRDSGIDDRAVEGSSLNTKHSMSIGAWEPRGNIVFSEGH